jgi:hypothetical protein
MMNILYILGILSAFAFLIPAVLLFCFKLYKNSHLSALLVYFLLTGVYNILTVGSIGLDKAWLGPVGVGINYLDAPLMLASLLFFANSAAQKKLITICLYSFLFYECIVMLIFGFNSASLVYIMAPGILCIFSFGAYYFRTYAKWSIVKNKGFGKTFMITSILFAYGCYAMVYCFYYLQQTEALGDVYSIYYIASLLSSVLMSIGIFKYNKRFRERNEVLVIRKELQLFFSS